MLNPKVLTKVKKYAGKNFLLNNYCGFKIPIKGMDLYRYLIVQNINLTVQPK